MTEPAISDAERAEDDAAVLAVIRRLARPDRSGGSVIERAAILAEGSHADAIVGWILDHAGLPDVDPVAPARGLHGGRSTPAPNRHPARYVLPAGALTHE